MAYTKEEVVKYTKELAQSAGLAPEAQEAFLKALENDGFATKLGEAVLRQSDYSRSKDALDKEKAALEGEKGKWTNWYSESMRQFDAQNEALKAYRETYGELNGNDGKPLIASPTGDVMTKKEFETWRQGYERDTVAVIKTASHIAVDHFRRFNEPLDMDALEKFTVESKLPLTVAYERFIAPRLSEKEKQESEARIKAARDEGYKAALSEHNLPIDTHAKSVAPHPFFGRPAPDKALSTQEKLDRFREAYETVPAPPNS